MNALALSRRLFDMNKCFVQPVTLIYINVNPAADADSVSYSHKRRGVLFAGQL
jgi:hypothetical protein